MKLYLLEDTRPTHQKQYDSVQSFLVAANTENAARKFAAKYAADEKASTWLDYHNSRASKIAEHSVYSEKTLVMRNFLAG